MGAKRASKKIGRTEKILRVKFQVLTQEKRILDLGMIMMLSFASFLLLSIAYISWKGYDFSPKYQDDCYEQCSKFNLTGIAYPNSPCICYRPECNLSSNRGTLFYSCVNEEDIPDYNEQQNKTIISNTTKN